LSAEYAEIELVLAKWMKMSGCEVSRWNSSNPS
jgi:hypothetical protein